jgi:hypothetical protein
VIVKNGKSSVSSQGKKQDISLFSQSLQQSRAPQRHSRSKSIDIRTLVDDPHVVDTDLVRRANSRETVDSNRREFIHVEYIILAGVVFEAGLVIIL